MLPPIVGRYIAFAVHDQDFLGARKIELEAVARGYTISPDRIEVAIRAAEKAAGLLKGGTINKEQWEASYDRVPK
jgi:hypothetical protein